MKQSSEIIIGKKELELLKPLAVSAATFVKNGLSYEQRQMAMTLFALKYYFEELGMPEVIHLDESLINERRDDEKT